MQIDLEMTFIVWGFHMQAYRTTRADKKNVHQANDSSIYALEGRVSGREHTADKQLPQP